MTNFRKVRIATALLLALVAGAATAATLTVTNTSDTGPGSLRQALLDANALAGLDTIAFAIPGAGVHTIVPASSLPPIIDPVVIDGSTQPGFAGTPLIELRGTYAPTDNPLFLQPGSDGSTIRGLVINRFNSNGISVRSSGNTIVGNYLGTDPTGTIAAGNSAAGVSIGFGNDNIVGGTAPGDGNLISSNTTGINIAFSTGTQIVGNRIGTNAAGTALLGAGFLIDDVDGAVGTVIGGTSPGARNLLAGNSVNLLGTGARMIGNYLGTDITGMIALGSTGIGVGGTGQIIGGPTAAERNVIVGGLGGAIHFNLVSSNHTVLGNYIGIAADGVTPLALLPTPGIILRRATNVTIGDVAPGSGNVIHGGPYSGVMVLETATAISIRGNTFLQTAMGIDLNGDGQTPNDPADADIGPNLRQNYPVPQIARLNSSSSVISGTLDSTPSTMFTLDFYTDDVCTTNGAGSRAEWIASTTVTTDAAGHASFNLVVTTAQPYIFGTATDPAGNTSEFSLCVATGVAEVPTLNGFLLSLLAVFIAFAAVFVLRNLN